MAATIKCALNWRGSKAYFFINDQYLRYDFHHRMTDPHYPRKVGESGFKGLEDVNLTAAFYRDQKTAYFFSGTGYYKYRLDKSEVAENYPKKVADHWAGIPAKPVDAAVRREGSAKVYFFLQDSFYCYDLHEKQADPGYPKTIKSGWQGIPWDTIDAVVYRKKNDVPYYYFFKDDEYVRYNLDTKKVDDNYPKLIKDHWPGLMESTWPDNRASAHITDFERSAKKGKWPKLKKDDLIEDIRKTVTNPYKVYQGRTGFCGPAAIVFELVHKKPDTYVNICRELFEKGYFKNDAGKRVSASDALKNSSKKSGISVADWMLMATLREDENNVFDITDTSGSFVTGMTLPCEMEKWAKTVLGYSKAKTMTTTCTGEYDALRMAHGARGNRGVGFFLIHGAMVGNDAPIVGYPNHWVSYMDSLSIDNTGIFDRGSVEFYCYTWGDRKRVNIGEGKFEDYFYGAVSGE